MIDQYFLLAVNYTFISLRGVSGRFDEENENGENGKEKQQKRTRLM